MPTKCHCPPLPTPSPLESNDNKEKNFSLANNDDGIDNPHHPFPLPPILCFVIIAMVQDHHEDNHGDEREKKMKKTKGYGPCDKNKSFSL